MTPSSLPPLLERLSGSLFKRSSEEVTGCTFNLKSALGGGRHVMKRKISFWILMTLALILTATATTTARSGARSDAFPTYLLVMLCLAMLCMVRSIAILRTNCGTCNFIGLLLGVLVNIGAGLIGYGMAKVPTGYLMVILGVVMACFHLSMLYGILTRSHATRI